MYVVVDVGDTDLLEPNGKDSLGGPTVIDVPSPVIYHDNVLELPITIGLGLTLKYTVGGVYTVIVLDCCPT